MEKYFSVQIIHLFLLLGHHQYIIIVQLGGLVTQDKKLISYAELSQKKTYFAILFYGTMQKLIA